MTETKKTKTETVNNPFFPEQLFDQMGLASFSERVLAMGEAQARTYKHMTEQVLGYGRQMGEHLSDQLAVSAKLTKDGLDYGINLWDAWAKVMIESAETTLENLTPRK